MLNQHTFLKQILTISQNWTKILFKSCLNHTHLRCFICLLFAFRFEVCRAFPPFGFLSFLKLYIQICCSRSGSSTRHKLFEWKRLLHSKCGYLSATFPTKLGIGANFDKTYCDTVYAENRPEKQQKIKKAETIQYIDKCSTYIGCTIMIGDKSKK